MAKGQPEPVGRSASGRLGPPGADGHGRFDRGLVQTRDRAMELGSSRYAAVSSRDAVSRDHIENGGLRLERCNKTPKQLAVQYEVLGTEGQCAEHR